MFNAWGPVSTLKSQLVTLTKNDKIFYLNNCKCEQRYNFSILMGF